MILKLACPQRCCLIQLRWGRVFQIRLKGHLKDVPSARGWMVIAVTRIVGAELLAWRVSQSQSAQL